MDIKNTNAKKLTAAVLSAAILVCSGAVPASADKPVFGDVDGDGHVTSNDALAALRISLGLKAELAPAGEKSQSANLGADIDGDGSVTSNDALLILRASIELDTLDRFAPGYIDPESRETIDTPEEVCRYPISDDPPTHPIAEPDRKPTVEEAVSGGIQDFSARFFKKYYREGMNTVLSPLSIFTALAMSDNGAAGDTEKQITDMLVPSGWASVDDMNAYFERYMTNINSGHIMRMSNSYFIIENDAVDMNPAFAETIQKSYFGEVFNEPANDETVGKINGWVKKNTDGMIDSILPEGSLTDESVAILLNAISFKGEWVEPYEDWQIMQDEFTNYDGTKSTADYLVGFQSGYMEDDKALAFAKPYNVRWDKKLYEETGEGVTEEYIFMAILPKDGVTIDEYINEMDSVTLQRLLHSIYPASVTTVLPKFTIDTDESILDIIDKLISLGMYDAFNPLTADFSNLAKSRNGNVYISDVLHKAHISLDENGTEAAAVTLIGMKDDSAIDTPSGDEITIRLDRPFIYAIYDTKNDVPVFLGTVCKLDGGNASLG